MWKKQPWKSLGFSLSQAWSWALVLRQQVEEQKEPPEGKVWWWDLKIGQHPIVDAKCWSGVKSRLKMCCLEGANASMLSEEVKQAMGATQGVNRQHWSRERSWQEINWCETIHFAHHFIDVGPQCVPSFMFSSVGASRCAIHSQFHIWIQLNFNFNFKATVFAVSMNCQTSSGPAAHRSGCTTLFLCSLTVFVQMCCLTVTVQMMTLFDGLCLSLVRCLQQPKKQSLADKFLQHICVRAHCTLSVKPPRRCNWMASDLKGGNFHHVFVTFIEIVARGLPPDCSGSLQIVAQVATDTCLAWKSHMMMTNDWSYHTLSSSDCSCLQHNVHDLNNLLLLTISGLFNKHHLWGEIKVTPNHLKGQHWHLLPIKTAWHCLAYLLWMDLECLSPWFSAPTLHLVGLCNLSLVFQLMLHPILSFLLTPCPWILFWSSFLESGESRNLK